MKNYIIVFFAFILFQSCKDKKSELDIPPATSEIKFSPIVRYDIDLFQNNPYLYIGDTALYKVIATSESDLKEIIVFKSIGNSKNFERDPSYPIITSFSSTNKHEFYFKYIPKDTGFVNFRFKVIEKTNAYREFDKYLYTHAIQETKDVKLYNIYSEKYNHILIRYSNYVRLVEVKSQSFYHDDMINLTKDENTDTYFNPGWRSGDGSNTTFIKIDNSLLDYESIDHIQLIKTYENNKSNSSNIIRNIKVGDLILVRYNDTPKESIVQQPFTYGLIRIDQIQDDGRSASLGGSDDDYITFSFKTFNNFRF